MPQIDTSLPDWIVRKNWLNSNSVSHDLQTGYQLGQRNREFAAMQEFRASQLRTQDAYRQAQINTQLMKQRQIEAEQTDAALVTQWMQDPRQPPPTGLRTPRGLKAVADVQRAFSETEIGSKYAAVTKAYTDRIKDLDATGVLKVQQLLNVNQGEMTPEIAAVIDAESERMKTGMADFRVIGESGEVYVKGGTDKPALIQSLKTGSFHRLPPDYNTENPVVTLRDEQNNPVGLAIRNASGGYTQLREHKVTEPTLSVQQKSAMNSEFKIVNDWWTTDLDSKQRAKKENQDELQRRLKAVQDKYSVSPATPAAAPTVADSKDPLGLFK